MSLDAGGRFVSASVDTVDTVEHEILLDRLRSTIGLREKVLSWFESYLKGRSQRECLLMELSQSRSI